MLAVRLGSAGDVLFHGDKSTTPVFSRKKVCDIMSRFESQKRLIGFVLKSCGCNFSVDYRPSQSCKSCNEAKSWNDCTGFLALIFVITSLTILTHLKGIAS